MKFKLRIICLISALLCLFNLNIINVSASSGEKIYLGGMPAGFSLATKGAHVVGLCDVLTKDGLNSPAKNAGLNVGDIILNIDGFEVNNAFDIEKAVKNDNEKTLNILRDNEKLLLNVTPSKDLSGNYKLGVFIKDDINGIGTITFIKNNRFASLGHPILDDNKNIVEISGGTLFDCSITGVIKGEKGQPGELRGAFLKTNVFASIDKNLDCGVYGDINSHGFENIQLKEIDVSNAKVGSASIYSTIDGDCTKEYSISIIKCDDENGNKNFVIKVTDKELLNKTGGIVQGMSGSPIVQDGKLIGAVTHVFVNDPTRGFGISIYKMLEKI